MKDMYNLSEAEFVIEPTTKCAAKCVMCPRGKFSHPLEDMSFSTFKRAADEIAKLGIKSLKFCGFGDPLMDKGLEGKLKYIHENYPQIELSMIDTCHLLTGGNLEMVCEHIDIIKISMYGFSKESYESVHGGALKYEQVKSNIDNLLNRKQRPYVIMTFCDLPQNHGTMDAWREYYEPRCERIDIWKPHNMGGGLKAAEGKITGLPCRRVMNLSNLIICTDGSITPCCFDFNRSLIIGNINETALDRILAGGKANELQEKHMQNDVSGLVCKHCDQIRGREDALIYSNAGMEVGKSSMQIFRIKK